MASCKKLSFEFFKSFIDKLLLVLALVCVGYFIQSPLQESQDTLEARSEFRRQKAQALIESVELLSNAKKAHDSAYAVVTLLNEFSSLESMDWLFDDEMPFEEAKDLSEEIFGPIKQAFLAEQNISLERVRLNLYLDNDTQKAFDDAITALFTEDDRKHLSLIYERFKSALLNKEPTQRERIALDSAIKKIPSIFKMSEEEESKINYYYEMAKNMLPTYYQVSLENVTY